MTCSALPGYPIQYSENEDKEQVENVPPCWSWLFQLTVILKSIQRVYVEHLLYARLCWRGLGYVDEQNTDLSPHGAHVFMGVRGVKLSGLPEVEWCPLLTSMSSQMSLEPDVQ